MAVHLSGLGRTEPDLSGLTGRSCNESGMTVLVHALNYLARRPGDVDGRHLTTTERTKGEEKSGRKNGGAKIICTTCSLR